MKNLVIALCLWLLCQPARAQDECHGNCVTSAEGIAVIQFFEGFSPFRYKDVGGLDTIGYGHLIVPGDRIPEPLLGDAAVDLLRTDLRRTEKGLNSGLTAPIAQHRFDALSSFAFNIGVAACLGSTPFRYTNAGRYGEVPGRLSLWVNVGGKPVRGLILRRAAEGRLYAR